MCECLYVHMCIHVYVRAGTCHTAYGQQKIALSVGSCLHKGAPAFPLRTCLACPMDFWGFSFLCTHLLRRTQGWQICYMSSFHVHSGILNSGPHVSVASVLPTEHPPTWHPFSKLHFKKAGIIMPQHHPSRLTAWQTSEILMCGSHHLAIRPKRGGRFWKKVKLRWTSHTLIQVWVCEYFYELHHYAKHVLLEVKVNREINSKSHCSKLSAAVLYKE